MVHAASSTSAKAKGTTSGGKAGKALKPGIMPPLGTPENPFSRSMPTNKADRNRWLKALYGGPTRTCATCGQTSHDWEKDWKTTKLEKVKWVKIEISKLGLPYFVSSECYSCFMTKRRFYSDPKKVSDHMDNKEFSAKFFELRYDQVM